MADGNANVDVLNGTAQGQLKSIVERVERLEVEKAEVAELIKEVFAEAKGNGFDEKILRMVIRLRKQDVAKRQEEAAVLDLYMSALGELPLFEPQRRTVAERVADGETRVTITGHDGTEIVTTTEAIAKAADGVRRKLRGGKARG